MTAPSTPPPPEYGLRGPFRLAVGLVILVVVVIVMGAMTTSTGSGLAFKDWPLSDGELMPERSYKTLPGFFEHFHRLPAGIAVLLAIGLAIWLARSSAAGATLRRWSTVGAVLIVVQAVIGGLGVLEELPLLSSATHGTLAQVTLAVMAITAYMLSPRYHRTQPEPHPSARSARKWSMIAFAFVLFQTVLGAIARHTTSGSQHALWTHVGNAFVVFLIVIAALGIAARLADTPGIRGIGQWAMGLLMIQIVLGFIALMVRRGKHPENIEFLWRSSLISSHVLIGALLTVLLALLAAHVRRGTRIPAAEQPASSWRAFIELGKPRLSALAVFAVVAGCCMGYPNAWPRLGVVVGTTIGTFLVACGAASLNMYRERELDARMHRTQDRPLPSGRLQPRQVVGFGVVASTAGLLAVAIASNLLAAALSGLILVSYVLIYTPMKVKTPLNTLVGAIPGALPPVVGYAAVTGSLGFGALVLFAILFCWQIPHFLAIAWRHREDYARAGMQMLPVVDPDGERTRMTMLIYTAGLGIASLLPFVVRMAGEVYLGTAICLDLMFFVPAVIAAVTRWESAMRMTFLASLVYLPLLLTVMVLDRQDPVFLR